MTVRTHTASLLSTRAATQAVGVLGLVAFGALSLLDTRAPLLGYLIGYVFWVDVAIGLLGLLMLQHVMRSDWGRALRPLLDAAAGTFPLLALLFLPIAFGVRQIYPWASASAIALHGDHVGHYFATPWFVVRSALYLLLWCVLGGALQHAPRDTNPAPGSRAARRVRVLSAWGLVLLALSSTFAAIDWVRSLAPRWHSTTFGLYALSGQGLSAFAFAALAAIWLARRAPEWRLDFGQKPLHDLAKLTLTFVILWAYIAFTQFLIIWAGNIPDETNWFVLRMRDGWASIGVALIGLHFALPFLLLLPRYTNKRAAWVGSICALLLVMRFVDVYWLVAPARDPSPWPPRWLALVATIGIGGMWCSALLWRVEQRTRRHEATRAPLLEKRA